MTRCSAIGLLPQRAPPATARSEAWGTVNEVTPLSPPCAGRLTVQKADEAAEER